MSRNRNLELELFWRDHVQRQHASGLKISVYCRQHDLSHQDFRNWRRTIARRDARKPRTKQLAPKCTAPTFLPVKIVAPKATIIQPESAVEIHLPGGRQVHVRGACDRFLLAEVLAILEDQ
jgi:hypothetical protein